MSISWSLLVLCLSVPLSECAKSATRMFPPASLHVRFLGAIPFLMMTATARAAPQRPDVATLVSRHPAKTAEVHNEEQCNLST